jgi:hypothetical protein
MSPLSRPVATWSKHDLRRVNGRLNQPGRAGSDLMVRKWFEPAQTGTPARVDASGRCSPAGSGRSSSRRRLRGTGAGAHPDSRKDRGRSALPLPAGCLIAPIDAAADATRDRTNPTATRIRAGSPVRATIRAGDRTNPTAAAVHAPREATSGDDERTRSRLDREHDRFSRTRSTTNQPDGARRCARIFRRQAFDHRTNPTAARSQASSLALCRGPQWLLHSDYNSRPSRRRYHVRAARLTTQG